jgi:tetratricopeptide (TPR) repeat protein
MMRKTVFMQEVRERIKNKPPDALRRLLIEFAHYIPRDEYEDVVLLLEETSDVKDQNKGIDLLTSVRKLCESVENGEYDFSYDYYEGGYGGYWSDDDMLIDQDGLGEEIEALLKAAICSVNEGRYAEAFQAFDELHSLTIPSEEYDDIDISSLFSYEIISLDEYEVQRHYAYAALMVLRNDARVEKLHEIFINDTDIRDILQVGSAAIPDQSEFSRQWIELLMGKEPRFYEKALIHAVKFSGGINALRDFVEEHGETYQAAYLELMKDYVEEKQFEQAIGIANSGLAKLKPINSNRTKIADFLLEIGQTLEDASLIETAAWEGFCSSVDLSHFIVLSRLTAGSSRNRAIQHLENYKSARDYLTIRFLNGDYGLVWDTLKKDKSTLGWSSSEKGKILPLFIVLLSGSDPEKPCSSKMIKNSYFNGKHFNDFIQVLGESLNELSDSDYQTYCDWCLEEISGRVEAIVKGQYRKSYYKASALIVSMAETIKSRGDASGAAMFIKRYKEKYPRHTSFHASLREDIKLAKFGKLF